MGVHFQLPAVEVVEVGHVEQAVAAGREYVPAPHWLGAAS